MQKINLPEKEWFTFDELAKRWQVDVETVAHYVWDLHLLRPAFIKKGLNFFDLDNFPLCGEYEKLKFDGYALQFIAKTPDNNDYNGEFYYLKTDAFDCDGEIASLESFRYQINMLPVPKSKHFLLFESYPQLMGTGNHFLTDFTGNVLDTSISVLLNDGDHYERCFPIITLCNDYYITREERDRFEALYSENEIKETGKTQEENTLYAIGVMAMLLAEKSGSLKIGNRPNAEQISKAVNEAADRYGLPDNGLKSLHKKIAEGLKLANKVGA